MAVPQTVTYPNPYNPGYSTIAQLVRDSTFIVMGTLGDPETATGQGGDTVTLYPIVVQQDFGTYSPRMAIGISAAELKAGNLDPNGTYIFFWASDPVDNTFCVVGGARGMFVYDSGSGTVTRVADSASSQVPPSQSLDQFSGAVVAAETQDRSQPISNPPPTCSTSATGIAQ
jgi:hypothetical protein